MQIKHQPTPVQKNLNYRVRFSSLDHFRGLIMLLMAVDHASNMIAKTHSYEYWGTALPVYSSAFWFLTRFITHFCAPGFFLIMGTGMVFLAASRRICGWNESRITLFFLKRGFLLIVLMFILEYPAWRISNWTAAPGAWIIRGEVPGFSDYAFISLGILYALGCTLIIWALLRRLPSLLILLISICTILLTQWLIPPSACAGIAYPLWLRFLLIPGRTGPVLSIYPLLPWMGVTGLGLLLGRALNSENRTGLKILLPTSLTALLLFITIRLYGEFGNFHSPTSGWIGFLNLTKYPPSLSFLLLTLGTSGILISLLEHLPFIKLPFLQTFGRTSLFFYLLHLYVYALIGIAFPDGTNLLTMYGIWLLGIIFMYPLCLYYYRFKQSQSMTSIWRYL